MTVLLISKVFSQEDWESSRFSLRFATAKPPALWPADDMPSEDWRGTKCDRRSRGSVTALGADAGFGGSEARKEP